MLPLHILTSWNLLVTDCPVDCDSVFVPFDLDWLSCSCLLAYLILIMTFVLTGLMRGICAPAATRPALSAGQGYGASAETVAKDGRGEKIFKNPLTYEILNNFKNNKIFIARKNHLKVEQFPCFFV